MGGATGVSLTSDVTSKEPVSTQKVASPALLLVRKTVFLCAPVRVPQSVSKQSTTMCIHALPSAFARCQNCCVRNFRAVLAAMRRASPNTIGSVSLTTAKKRQKPEQVRLVGLKTCEMSMMLSLRNRASLRRMLSESQS